MQREVQCSWVCPGCGPASRATSAVCGFTHSFLPTHLIDTGGKVVEGSMGEIPWWPLASALFWPHLTTAAFSSCNLWSPCRMACEFPSPQREVAWTQLGYSWQNQVIERVCELVKVGAVAGKRWEERSWWINFNVIPFQPWVLCAFEMKQIPFFKGDSFLTGTSVVLASNLHEFPQMEICLWMFRLINNFLIRSQFCLKLH